jgi:hypothetical protein
MATIVAVRMKVGKSSGKIAALSSSKMVVYCIYKVVGLGWYMLSKLMPYFMVAVLLTSCASLGDPFVLLFDVDGEYKSDAVTSSGIDAYKRDLVAGGDVASSAKVQRYFEVALRYDPNNAEASKYLALVEDFRANKFSSAVRDAEALLKKPTRSQNEEYVMLIAVNKASAIYPQDDASVKLVKATEETRRQYISARLAEADKVRASIKPESKEAIKEKAYIDAFGLVLKVRAVDPVNLNGNKAYRELKTEISAIVENRLKTVENLTGKKSFDEAKSVLSVIKDLDSKIGETFKPDISKAEYALYLSWAKYHESRKEWSSAATRVRSALAVQKGSDALALQKRVSAAAAAEDRGTTFEAGLKNLDAYIAGGQLVKAQRLLSSLSKTAADSAKRQTLETRRKKILDALAGVYQSGVQAYREEKYKEAISILETVVAVDASYADAADYLDKAKARQKLLDQY